MVSIIIIIIICKFITPVLNGVIIIVVNIQLFSLIEKMIDFHSFQKVTDKKERKKVFLFIFIFLLYKIIVKWRMTKKKGAFYNAPFFLSFSTWL